MEILEQNCQCGHPDCKEKVSIRTGAVYSPDRPEAPFSETIIDPDKARRMAWRMVWAYLPVFRHLYQAYQFGRRQLVLW